MTEPNMAVSIAGVTLKNPVMTASGTFGVSDFVSKVSFFVSLFLLSSII